MGEIVSNSKKEIIWISIARGFAVLLVVVNHIIPRANSTFESAQLLWKFNEIISFHMALFFFISGYLFYHTKIEKGSSFSSVLKTNVTRIIYPYVFITVTVFLIKIILASYIKNPINLTPWVLFEFFIYPDTNPWMNLWFLNAILIYFLLYPLFKKSLSNTYTIILSCIIIILLNVFIPEKIRFLDFSTVIYYLIFFYAGILSSKYKVERYLKHSIVGILFLIIFILTNIFDWYKIILHFSGIGASICFSIFFAKHLPRLFSSFRNYYYQIYLFGTFFQAIVLEFFMRLDIENVFLSFCIISVLSALYIPILLSKLIIKINWEPLQKVMGL